MKSAVKLGGLKVERKEGERGCEERKNGERREDRSEERSKKEGTAIVDLVAIDDKKTTTKREDGKMGMGGRAEQQDIKTILSQQRTARVGWVAECLLRLCMDMGEHRKTFFQTPESRFAWYSISVVSVVCCSVRFHLSLLELKKGEYDLSDTSRAMHDMSEANVNGVRFTFI